MFKKRIKIILIVMILLLINILLLGDVCYVIYIYTQGNGVRDVSDVLIITGNNPSNREWGTDFNPNDAKFSAYQDDMPTATIEAINNSPTMYAVDNISNPTTVESK